MQSPLFFWIPGRASYRQLARNDGGIIQMYFGSTTSGWQ
jgi:hypothetical protein